MAVLLVLVLAAWTNAARGAGVSESFHTTGVSLADVTKPVKAGQPVVFESQLGSQQAYDFQLQLQNSGSKTVAVQSVVVNVYLGGFHDSIPDDAAPLATQPVQVGISLVRWARTASSELVEFGCMLARARAGPVC